MTYFDHHIHSTRSDGTIPLEGRARTAAARPHGVSDHYPWPGGMRADDDILRYLDDASRLGLHVGIEYDLGSAPPLRPATRDALHYVIGSVHQVTLDGRKVDYSAAGMVLKGRSGATSADVAPFADPKLARRVLEAHLTLVREGILEQRIDIVGHPTLSPLAALRGGEDAYPAEWQDRLIELCVTHGVAIEVNEAYGVPHRELLVRAHAAGALFSVGSDSHFELRPLDRTLEMIRAAALVEERFLTGSRRAQAGASTTRSS